MAPLTPRYTIQTHILPLTQMHKKYLLPEYISWPLSLFFVSRIGLFALVYFSLLFLPLNSGIDVWHTFPNNLLLDGWGRWDTGWYLDIVKNGYDNISEGQTNRVFFPLYPLLIRAFNQVTGHSALSGLILSNLSFAIALVLLFKLIHDCYDRTVARWSLLLLVTFPFSFYFSAIYSESLFLLVIVATFYFGHQQKWPLAAVCAALACATRGTGFTVIVGLLALYLKNIEFDLRKIRPNVLWLLFSPAGLLAYMFFLWYKFDQPFIFMTGRYVPGWEEGQGLSTAWQIVVNSLSVEAIITGGYSAIDILHILLSVIAFILLILSFRKLHIAHFAWSLVCLLISFVAGWHGMGRYILPIFPCFVSVPLLIKQESVLMVIIYFNILFLSLFAILYSHFYWVS